MKEIAKGCWFFPDSNGLLTGADGGSSASNFRGDPIKGICKENLQNPIDARPDKTIPAFVEFQAFSLPAECFPGRDDLAKAITKTKATAQPEGNSREEIFFAEAENYISKSEIPFLRISDNNTTGLLGSDAKTNDSVALRNSNWLHLVRGMGMTTKHTGDGGSHGKGKSAAIANSAISTIFYSTIDIEGKQAFQGVAYLPLFVDDNDILKAGIGFYGMPGSEIKPIESCCSLDPNYNRQEPGTDIYIAGFSKGDRWEERLFICVLNEYLLALYKEILIVKIGDILISRETLPELIPRYAEIRDKLELDINENYADACWDAIISPELPSDVDHLVIEGMGADLQMFVKTGAGPRKTDQIRQIGMRINAYDGKRQFPFPFVGCLYISGTEINQFLAGLEDETHCKWETNRAGDNDDNEKKAARCLTRIKRYINEKISQLYKIAKDNKLDAEGMEEYFPINLDDEDPESEPTESIKNNIASVQIRKYTPAGKSEEYNAVSDEGPENDLPYSTPETQAEPEQQPEPEPQPEPQPKPEPQPEPEPIPEGDPQHNEKPGRMLKMKRKNSIGADGKYVLALQGEEEHNAAYVQVFLSGEDSNEAPQIVSAKQKTTGEDILIKGDFIGPFSLSSSEITKILIITEEKTSYSLGVNVYAY